MPTLNELRAQIDKLDDEVVSLLNKRAELVLQVKTAKEKDKLDTYSPSRERQILDRVGKLAEAGKFPRAAVEKIFGTIISATRSLIGETSVAYVGPEFSLGHEASVKQFGEAVQHTALASVEDVISKVERGDVNYGIVPAESGGGGLVLKTFAALVASKLSVVAEVLVKERLVGSDARFLVLGTKVPAKSGNDKTSIACAVPDKAGSLRDVLAPFAERGITLLRIESKKLPDNNLESLFFIDFVGHVEDAAVVEVLAALQSLCANVRVLGSYSAKED